VPYTIPRHLSNNLNSLLTKLTEPKSYICLNTAHGTKKNLVNTHILGVWQYLSIVHLVQQLFGSWSTEQSLVVRQPGSKADWADELPSP
jgi:hypothetical protein